MGGTTRRRLLRLLGGGLAAAALPAFGQGDKSARRVGLLFSGAASTMRRLRASVLEGIGERPYELHERFADNRGDALDALAGELVKLPVDLIVAQGVPAIAAARKNTASIPIVCITSSELAPAANVTGVVILGSEAAPKQLELLHELVPAAKRVGYIASKRVPDDRLSFEEMQAASRGLGVETVFVEAVPDLNAVFRAAVREKVEAIVVSASLLGSPDWPNVMRLAASRKLPAVYGFNHAVGADGLASCEVNRQAFFRLAGEQAARILGGARPADLPVRRPDRFEITINVRTATQLGIPVPESLRQRATRIIE